MLIVRHLGFGLIALILFMAGQTFVQQPPSTPEAFHMSANSPKEIICIVARIIRAIQAKTKIHSDIKHMHSTKEGIQFDELTGQASFFDNLINGTSK